jgi:hypothetical protein
VATCRFFVGAVAVASLPQGDDEKAARAGIAAWDKFRDTMQKEFVCRPGSTPSMLRCTEVSQQTVAQGHSRPMHSVPVPIDVRCYSNSDIVVWRSEVTLRA